MILKKYFKKKLGDKYYNYRLNRIFEKVLGKEKFFFLKKFSSSIKNKFSFIKIKLNKKIGFQSITHKERGFIIDYTKNNFLSIHLRPKNSNDFFLESTCNINEKIAIIIQGPIQDKIDFLRETLNIYKKIFKNSIVIISTWKNENQKLIDNFKNSNTYVIYSEEPNKETMHNIDKQIISTNAGLKLALKLGAKYSLKTRADVRLNKNNLETFLLSLIKTFPVKKNKLISSRIIVPSLVTYKFRIFSLSDIVLFGNTDDLLIYFKDDNYIDGLKKFGLNKKNVLINGTPLIPEVFLCARYLQKLEENLDWSLEFWWKSLKEYFCIIDNSSLDLFWYKYNWDYEYRIIRTYSNKFARGIDFQDWLSLYNDFENNWKLASNDHERYNNQVKLLNIFK
ncbi:WavE lipopolysaccharide synthesis family protein [Candidatus Pelagibacter sp. HIMB1715]|uniref:WavE lipopolysaccharide synthesis family protein n=1 Tax=Candidatus Pelagibacter sp. HIMB1715 TaxID=3413369 RepID=UPI003F8331F1